jgi:hypothetical protein
MTQTVLTQRFVHYYAGVRKCNKLKKTDKNDVCVNDILEL